MRNFVIMLKQTAIYDTLKKTRSLFDSWVWYEAFTPAVKTMVLDLIRKDQLTEKGIDEDGDIIGLYSRATELLSDGRKQEGDPFDLNDTGAFYRSMFITATSDSIIIDGDTEKMEESFSQTNGYWWRNEILGLTDENLQKLANEIKNKYIETVRKVLELDK